MCTIDLSKSNFGDVFKTRSGIKAILLHKSTNDFDGPSYMFISARDLGSYSQYYTDINGRAKVSNDWKERDHDVDIVDIWKE